MKIALVSFGILCLFWSSVWGTKVAHRDLYELLEEADHVLVCKVEKVKMVDGAGSEVLDKNARTGPGIENQIWLQLVLQENGVLKTNAKEIPTSLMLSLWRMWHSTLGNSTERYDGKELIFLLKGEDFRWVYPSGFDEPVSKRALIERILRAQACLKKECGQTAEVP